MGNCMLEVLRKEDKYLISTPEAIRSEHMFEKILHTDKFSKDDSYTVRTLYFDTVDDRDFFDKLNEQNLRRKVRLRIYNYNDQTAKLELKQNTIQHLNDQNEKIMVEIKELEEIIERINKGESEVIVTPKTEQKKEKKNQYEFRVRYGTNCT